jgi:pyrimidine operon attenuation protein/uracil phosphoribosyltransferase
MNLQLTGSPDSPVEKTKIMSAEDFNHTCRRFASQIIESYGPSDALAIVGMQTRGVQIGRRICQIIENEFQHKIDFGILDATFYRDDFRTKLKMPNVQITEIPFDLYNRHIVLVDDVLYTGRTLRSALDALMSYGRPATIKFCCMVDRGHRELPVAADYVGINLTTRPREEVRVKVKELDDEDAVYVVQQTDENS